MIAAVEADQDAAPRLADIDPILVGDLERDLDRGRAVVREEHAREIAGEEPRDGSGEIDGGLMGEAREHHMLEQVRLLRQRGVDLRMRMPMRAGPPRRDEVEDLLAVGVEQRRALGAREYDRVALGAVLGKGMPHMTPVARQHVAREASARAFGFGSSFMIWRAS